MTDSTGVLIKVGSSTDVQGLASSITSAFRDSSEVVVRAVGAGSVNQSAKAIAIARGHIAPSGNDLFCRIGFTTIHDLEKEVTAIVFRLTLQ